MKKRIFSLSLALSMALALLAPAVLAAPVLTEVIPPQFDEAEDFSEGLAAVELHDKWGFVDKTGKIVVPFQYDDAESFSQGLAAVELHDKWGFIDPSGSLVIPCRYNDAESFSEGLAAVEVNNLWGFVDQSGQIVVPCQYHEVEDFHEGLAAVMNGGLRWGFIDKTGKEVVPCRYDEVEDFSEGLAAVYRRSPEYCGGNCESGTWGYVDPAGKEVIPLQYGDADSFHDGLATVFVDSGETNARGERLYGYRFIDKSGAFVSSYYAAAEDFCEGMAAVTVPSGKWGFIDQTGKEVVPCKYSYVEDFSEGLAAVRNDSYSTGFIDKSGKEVIPLRYHGGWDFSEGYAVCLMGGRFLFVDSTGGEVYTSYNLVEDVHEGMAAVCSGDPDEGGKWGYVSLSGDAPAPVPTPTPAVQMAYPSTQSVNVDGRAVTFQCYALKDERGNATNYIKLRDLAILLGGSAAQFSVGWDGSVTITTKTAYTPNGSELSTPFSGERSYQQANAATKVNGQAVDLSAFVLNDDQGGGYTYYQLRDLGRALGFNVGWSGDKGIFIETNKPYDPNN